MIKQQTVLSADKIIIPIKAETICIHGDGEHAVEFAKQINSMLIKNKIELKPIEPIL